MLVVSNIDLTNNISTISPSTFLESSIKDFTLNLDSDYRYLKTGYYVSLHAEILGNRVMPSSTDIIDASRTPIMLLKAHKAGIPTLPNLTTSSVKQIMAEFDFPMVIFSVNPFAYDGFDIVKNRSALYRTMKSLGMNYKFTVCAQPLLGEMMSFKSFFGRCELEGEFIKISKETFRLFHIPICRLHTQKTDKGVFLCGLQPLKREEISISDLERIQREVLEMSKTVNLVG